MSVMEPIYQEEISLNIKRAVDNWNRPCVLFKPSLRLAADGFWDVYYDGNYLGAGKSPEEAMASFDVNWRAGTVLKPRPFDRAATHK